MVARHEDWAKRLSAYLVERRAMPFEWGVNDCMSFVAKGVEAMTGVDYFTEFSDYHDEDSARAMMEAHGGPHGIITQCLGTSSKFIMKAQRGDVALVKIPELTGGIIDDTGQFVALVSRDGLVKLPVNKAWRVWKV